VKPDVVVYDKKKSKPMYDLIFGCRTMKGQEMALGFQTKEINIDEIVLSMRDINSLITSKTEKPGL